MTLKKSLEKIEESYIALEEAYDLLLECRSYKKARALRNLMEYFYRYKESLEKREIEHEEKKSNTLGSR